jgi:hypothetical protein
MGCGREGGRGKYRLLERRLRWRRGELRWGRRILRYDSK